jgi:hypothetical protein
MLPRSTMAIAMEMHPRSPHPLHSLVAKMLPEQRWCQLVPPFRRSWPVALANWPLRRASALILYGAIGRSAYPEKSSRDCPARPRFARRSSWSARGLRDLLELAVLPNVEDLLPRWHAPQHGRRLTRARFQPKHVADDRQLIGQRFVDRTAKVSIVVVANEATRGFPATESVEQDVLGLGEGAKLTVTEDASGRPRRRFR